MPKRQGENYSYLHLMPRPMAVKQLPPPPLLAVDFVATLLVLDALRFLSPPMYTWLSTRSGSSRIPSFPQLETQAFRDWALPGRFDIAKFEVFSKFLPSVLPLATVRKDGSSCSFTQSNNSSHNVESECQNLVNVRAQRV